MSLTISPLSSLVQSSINSQLLANVSGDSTTSSSVPSIADITTAALNKTSAPTGFATDLANLFKDLASNNVSAAQSDLSQLKKDLGVSSSSSPNGSTSTPLQQLLSSVSTSLSSGDTTGALKSLASFFSQSSTPTGNAINTSA